jgi:hypothetical protein
METDVRQMATVEIQEQIVQLEQAYTDGLNKGSDIHTLNTIWKRIKELQNELKNREQSSFSSSIINSGDE